MVGIHTSVDHVSAQLVALSKDEAVQYLIFQCARMMYCLEKFAQDTHFDISEYQRCMNAAWLYLEGNSSEISFEAASQRCFDSAPDTEVFNHDLTSVALSACLGIGMLMEFIHSNDRVLVVDVNQLVFDAVALHLQATEAPYPLSLQNDEIFGHQKMQREVALQIDAIQFCATDPELSELRKYTERSDIELII